MPLIPEQALDDILARIDLAEVIGRYIPLQRAGRHFKALCPFHRERTPSFHINTEKQIFHCFGCGVGGNAFSFLMQQERLTFPEAARRLAEESGVSLPETSRDGQTDQLLEVLEKACRYFERLLEHPQHGRDARDYLKQRGVTEQTRKVFRLGRAPSGWDELIQASRRSKVPLELLAQAGLTVQGSRGALDRFRLRLMFPIQDVRGRVIGFGGRSLAGQEPKYLNGPETSVYHKGRQLFGLAQAKDGLVKAKLAIVVEGYFDCVLLWQAGVTHVVSPLGTAFTPEQARMLSRYAERVVLAFDADAAGEAASLRGIDVLLEAGLLVQVAQLPSGIDPDEFVCVRGLSALERLVDESLHVVEFLLACAKKRYDVEDREGKVRAAQSVLPTIAKVPNAMLRTEYLRSVADALHLDERAVTEELHRLHTPSRLRRAPVREEPRGPIPGAERLFVGLILDEPSRWKTVTWDAVMEGIRDGRLRRLVAVLGELHATGSEDPPPSRVITRLEDEGIGPLVSELVELAQSVTSKDKAFQECMQRLIGEARKRQLEALQEQIRATEASGQERELARLLDAYQRLVKGLGPLPTSADAVNDLHTAVMEESAHGLCQA